MPIPTEADMSRRRLVLAAAIVLSGCAGSAPPPRLYQLRIDAPVAVAPPPADAPIWELSAKVPLPESLDREAIVVASGDSGLQVLFGHRWAEPLRDSVPRLLRHDLGLLRGDGRVWMSPAPTGLLVARQLRVEVLSLLANADRSALQLQARWSLVDPSARVRPATGSARIDVAVSGAAVDDVVIAHRLALWRLAERIAAASDMSDMAAARTPMVYPGPPR